MIKALLFSLLFFVEIRDKIEAFKFTDSIIKIGNNTAKVTGTMLLVADADYDILYFNGINLSTMTPYLLVAMTIEPGSKTAPSTLNCDHVVYKDKAKRPTTGTLKYIIDSDVLRLEGECKVKSNNQIFHVSSAGQIGRAHV